MADNVELIHDALRSMMFDRAIKLDFDVATNRIQLFGRSGDHDDVIEIIKNYRRSSSHFSMVRNSGFHDLQNACGQRHASSTATGETNAKIANLQTNRPGMTGLLDTPCAAEGGRVRPIRASKGPSS
ncbi:MAG: hypothetical protein GY743_09025, partial [Planctomycetaceae bacterium]|nr:hypothetical protein [Planctomycetaceae bacterium]